MVPPVTGRESTADQVAGVTKLQELGAAACTTSAPLPWRRNRTEIATRRELFTIKTGTPYFFERVQVSLSQDSNVRTVGLTPTERASLR